MNLSDTNINSEVRSEISPYFKLNHDELAYLLLRVGLGINICFHGVVRIPKLQTFADGMIAKFSGSMLPNILVTPMAYAIPIVELIIGAAIILGIKTTHALTANAILMFTLIFGCCMIESFSSLNSQMLILLITVGLIAKIQYNRFYIIK